VFTRLYVSYSQRSNSSMSVVYHWASSLYCCVTFENMFKCSNIFITLKLLRAMSCVYNIELIITDHGTSINSSLHYIERDRIILNCTNLESPNSRTCCNNALWIAFIYLNRIYIVRRLHTRKRVNYGCYDAVSVIEICVTRRHMPLYLMC